MLKMSALKSGWRPKEKGVVLIAVLIFMAAIVPVTILILDSVRIESLTPVSENYAEIAFQQADLGFYEAIGLIIEDQHLVGVDPSRLIPDDYDDPMIKAGAYIYKPSDINTSLEFSNQPGTHDLDYLTEAWARHPENDTYYIIERSLENYDDLILNPFPNNNNDEVSSVPARWALPNVPLGMDDFGEMVVDPLTMPDDPPGLIPVYEDLTNLSDRNPLGDERGAPHSITQYNPGAGNDSNDLPIVSNGPVGSLNANAELTWRISRSDPGYIWPNKIPRPASYFRNNFGANGDLADNLVYDSMFDGDDSTNQYLPSVALQEAVTHSTWANTFFGNSYTNNKEYKPAPGDIFPSPIGTEGDILPAWHKTIVSDESGRFPINLLLNFIFSSTNYDYNEDGFSESPVVKRDLWDDAFYDEVISEDDHPNHPGFLLARDMLISLLISDEQLRDDAPAPLNTAQLAYDYHALRAEWIIRQMLYKRYMTDLRTDYNSDANFDTTYGENDNLSTLVELDGNGRSGDGPDMWDGTWQIYRDPKSLMSDFAQDDLPSVAGRPARPTLDEFSRLHQRVTVYSFSTECVADFQENPYGEFKRININRIQATDNDLTSDIDESLGYNKLKSLLGDERLKSILWWRDGLIDLNGDGDLDDEYIEQPMFVPIDDEAVSTLTYRERGHANFQDPSLLTADNHVAHVGFDPDYLNIPSLGALLTIPMAGQTNQILYSDYVGGSNYQIRNLNPASGVDSLVTGMGNSDYLYPNLSPLGRDFLVETGDDIATFSIGGGAGTATVGNAFHPSYDGNGQRICYTKLGFGFGGRGIYWANADGSGETLIIDSLQPGVNIPGPVDFIDLLPGFPGTPLLPPLEVGAPDWNPSTEPGLSELIVFSSGPDSPPGGSRHRLMVVTAGGFGPFPLTAPAAGEHDICPVFTPDGEWVIFTRLEFPGGQDDFANVNQARIRSSLRAVQITTGLNREIHVLDIGTQPADLEMCLPLYPTVSPDGDQVAFVAFDETWNGNWTPSGTDPNPGIDIYTIPLALPPHPDPTDPAAVVWATNVLDSGDMNIAGQGIAWSPDWGLGPVSVGTQGDLHWGNSEARGIPMSGYDPITEREDLADELQLASAAFRISLERGRYQQFLFADYPAVSSLQVEAMKEVADKYSVRDAYVYNPMEDPGNPLDSEYLLQAYSPKVNINTAPRPVLRSILLTMFQGPVWQSWDNYTVGPAPRGDANSPIQPINLLDIDTGPADRLLAIRIADTYAHQIVEYRKWLYNNRGVAGITPETVPDRLSLLVGTDAQDHRYNYRANPHYPVSLDNDPNTIDKPFFDPAPPFRSVADLFRIMLYEDTGSDWRLEGIDSPDGPDRDDLPETVDVSNGNPLGNIDALQVWGPIYIENGELSVSHGGAIDDVGQSIRLFGFENHKGYIDPNDPSLFYLHQQFRLFSMDDFKRVEPFLTTRTYVYRIESRGVVRIASGAKRMDVTRDKLWIVSVNRDAYYGLDLDGAVGDDEGLTNDRYFLKHADIDSQYSILLNEESVQGGFSLVRRWFVP